MQIAIKCLDKKEKKGYIFLMKKFVFLFCVLISVASVTFGGAFLSFFHARSESDNVVLNWQTTQEINLDNYIVERKTSDGAFMEIGTEEAKGDNSTYTFVDENAYKGDEAVYLYRLKIVDAVSNEITYSIEVAVSHSPSPVKRTWGSIKALFR